ncbi:VWA containing CoxE family protein [Lujinxingia litoralis]|uniref:VWA containing CoxE family protein n=1 Tax=Lujinxingia litoralis TaxID=2211119 RepID=A0A328C1H7_9DELT|nr:VWA domain-containing protein [Lujinxingia litoralis]RAL20273.1 VWA containing CoxE family protein [Lujinxingia litoralis]
MFIDFLYLLRQAGIPVSTTEYLALCQALKLGLAHTSLQGFYVLARATLIKRAEHFDRYDQVFAAYFKDRPLKLEHQSSELQDDLLEWLKEAGPLPALSPEEIARLEGLDLDELRQQFEERLAEQDARHDGGNRWIGTGGTSPFGHSGHNPAGVRVGGTGQRRSAVQVATERRFRNLRTDLVLDTRQISLALRKLRDLARQGRADELDIEATIEATGKNAGDIEMVFRPPRHNRLKLLLLMDVGGSMTPHTHLTSLLFSAANRAHHFQAFESYYFHNCFYETLYTDMERRQGRATAEVLAGVDESWRCIVVGDAAMAPTELSAPGGAIDYYHFNEEPGSVWLQRLAHRVPRTAWINPDDPRWWGSYTTRQIGRLFPMFPLTLEGLDRAIAEIR